MAPRRSARVAKRKAGEVEAARAAKYAGVGANELAERLRNAARDGDLDLLHELIAGADVNKASSSLTALMYASSRGHEPCLLALVAAGAFLGQSDINGGTALIWANACINGYEACGCAHYA